MKRGARGVVLLLAGLAVVLGASVRRDVPRLQLLPKYAGPASRFALIEGMRVHYRDEGAGPPLVLIHGASSSLHTWDGWVARLSGRRRIVRLDLPGFGLTGPAPDRDYTSARLARVVVALMDRLQLDCADVAGNSLGGRVALTMALAYPTRVRRLVLVDAAGLSGQKPAPIFRLARIPVLNGLLRWTTPEWLFRKNVDQVYGEPSRVTDALVDRYYDLTLRAGNRQALIDRLTGPVDPPLDSRLAEIQAPALVEWGERDPRIPIAFGRRLQAGLRDAKLVVYPSAAHVPMEELPEETARDADAFLGAGAGGSLDAMVQVPEGAFTMGCTEGAGHCMEGGLDQPARSVWVSAFAIDKTEVTRRAYAACVAAGACAAHGGVDAAGDGELPVTNVAWEQARAYCAWAGKRLPTEAEWEKAARGADERRYPWGSEAPRCDVVNFEGCGGVLKPVGGFPAGASPYGALDMAGNAEEWVSDWFGAGYYATGPARDPHGPDAGTERVVRGGSYLFDEWHTGVTVRMWDRGAAAPERGFRCAR